MSILQILLLFLILSLLTNLRLARELIHLKRYLASFTRIMEDLQKFHSMPK